MSRPISIEKDSIKLDKSTNRIIISLPDGPKVEICPMDIREFLPVINEEDKVKELFMMLHELDKEPLTQMTFYTRKMTELEDGIESARKQLSNCETNQCVNKWKVIIKSYVDEKNTLAEIRRSVGLLDKIRRKPLEYRIAALGHDPNDRI